MLSLQALQIKPMLARSSLPPHIAHFPEADLSSAARSAMVINFKISWKYLKQTFGNIIKKEYRLGTSFIFWFYFPILSDLVHRFSQFKGPHASSI